MSIVQRVRNFDIRWECCWSHFADEKKLEKQEVNDQKQIICLHFIPLRKGTGIQGNMVAGVNSGWEEMKAARTRMR